jgi:RimK family alpha-L-glutamate ligase
MAPIVAVVAWQSGKTNGPMVEAWRRLGIAARLLTPDKAALLLNAGDVAVIRLDVLPTLDGVEDGLDDVVQLERRGIRVLNTPSALVAAHDKLETARRLERAGLPHPRTFQVETLAELAALELPFVIKPRFGSWGRDVMRCETAVERERCLAVVQARPWFRSHGALAQELLASSGTDLRLVLAGQRVVGAAERHAAPGQWRTNVSLGGTPTPAQPPVDACRLGASAAEALGADLVGIDLFPTPAGGYVVLEANGAVDFLDLYSFPGSNVFTEVASAFGLLGPAAETAGGTAP